MELIAAGIDFFLHLDARLDWIFENFQGWTYLVLFLIIFAETGLVVMPFLPGDSLLFAVGALAARGNLGLVEILLLLPVAAILGDNVNYHAGKWLAPHLIHGKRFHLINARHLERTHAFFEKYGGKTVIIARFIPIVRTFAPFVAGLGAMTYRRFIGYCLAGGLLWIYSFVLAGFYFGNLVFVKRNFTIVVLVIIAISVMPAVIEFIRARTGHKDFPLEGTAETKGDEAKKS